MIRFLAARRRWRAGIVFALLCLPASSSVGSPEVDPRCDTRETMVVVRLDSERIHLCIAGRSEIDFGLSLGRGGVGKTREGDGRTPVGTFSLGEPRASSEFQIFIPIGYPTVEQRGA